MEGDRRATLLVGLFVAGSLLVLAVAILSLSAERGLWTPRYRLVAHFDNVQGLLEGAPVRLAGKDVGIVESVTFGTADGEHPPVRVVMQIDTSVQELIRADSVARIGTIGLLGDRYVEISMGSPDAPVLADGATVRAVTPLDIADVMERGNEALASIASLAENLNEVVEEFDETGGARSVAESFQAFASIVREVQEGDGLLHSLIYDRYQGSGVESIEQSLASLEDILRQIRYGDGVLHSLIYEAPEDQDIVMQTLEAGARLNSILSKIDRGEGTLGLLVSDPTLYDDLKLLVGGARRSRVVRALIELVAGSGE